MLKKLVDVLHQLDKLILTFITKLNLNKIEMFTSLNNIENINQHTIFIFGVQYKSFIELTLLQIGELNDYDKIVCHSCLYNSNMYCLCKKITLTQMLYLRLIFSA